MEEIETEIVVNPHRKNINGRLPPDSLVQIWARLPLKSLYKLRAVCKLWNSKICSDPLLSNLRHHLATVNHRLLHPPPPNLLLFLRHPPNEWLKPNDQPVFLSTHVIEDVVVSDRDPNPNPIKNGFTLHIADSIDLLPSKGPVVCFASSHYFYLCNPSSQEFLRIDGVPTSNGGLGFLDQENRYILVRIFDSVCDVLEFGPGQAESASWRRIESECPSRIRGYGVMVNRTFFWIIPNNGDDFLLYLDTREEKFGVVPRPQGNQDEAILYDHLYLVELKGTLCAVDNFSRPPRISIWGLNQNGVEFNWVRKYNIYISGMDRDLVYPFCDYEGENGGEMVLCNGTRSRIYCYNLKNRSIKQVYKPKHRTSDRLSVYTPGPFPLSITG